MWELFTVIEIGHLKVFEGETKMQAGEKDMQ